MNIKEILSLNAGVSGLEVKAMVKWVGKIEEKTGPKGMWKAQSISIKDDSGESFVQLNKESIFMVTDDVGREVLLSGIMVKEWQGKKSLRANDVGFMDIVKPPTPGDIALAKGIAISEGKEEKVKPEPTDWSAKEKREIRSRLYIGTLATIYKEQLALNRGPEGELPNDLLVLEKVKSFAEEGYKFVYEVKEEKEIPF